MDSRLAHLFARRSVRAFVPKSVSEDMVRAIFEAAMAAPSAVNKRPYDFIRVDDKALLGKIAELLPNGKFLVDAPLGIVVCGDISKAHANELSFLLQDCSAAIENILLAVSALGLGACWLGVHPRPERIEGLRRLFDLPETIIPVSVIAVGHPAGSVPGARTQYDPSRIHVNRW